MDSAAEAVPPPDRAPGGLRAPALALLLGAAISGVFLAAALRPAWVLDTWRALRYGAQPDQAGLLVTLEPAPEGTAGAGEGPWVLVVLRNVGSEPRPLHWTDPPGGGLTLRAWDAAGAELPPRDLATTEPFPVRRTTLAPGERLGLVVDAGRWLRFPGPGDYSLVAERAPFGSVQMLRSTGVARSDRLEVPYPSPER